MQQFQLNEEVVINDNHYAPGTKGVIIGSIDNPLRDDVCYMVWIKGPGAGHKEEFFEYELLKAPHTCACEGGCSPNEPAVVDKPVFKTVREELEYMDLHSPEDKFSRNIFNKALCLIRELEGSRRQAEAVAEEIAGDYLKQMQLIIELKAEIIDLEEELKDLGEELDLSDSMDVSYVRAQVAATVLGGMLANGDQTYDCCVVNSVDITDRLLKVLRGSK